MRRLLTVIAGALVFSTSSMADPAGPEMAARDLNPMSRAELKAVVEKGEAVVGRTVRGEDVAAVLGEFLSAESSCAALGAMRLEKSVVRGDITMASDLVQDTSQNKPSKEAEEDDDSDADEVNQKPSRWLSIPLLIRDSSVDDLLSLTSIGFACAVDFSHSTFENVLSIRTTTFMADFTAEGSTFKAGIQSQGPEFKSAVNFRRAKFMGNVEFISAPRSRSSFDGSVDFREAMFGRLANFGRSSFSSHMDFRYAQFTNDANFSGAKLGTGPAKSFGGAFYMAEFAGSGNFRNARFKSLRFWHTIFRNGADFHDARGHSLQLLGVAIRGPLAFDDAEIDKLELNGFGGSMVVDGDAVFRRSVLDELTFSRMAFKKTVDFEEASIKSRVRFRAVSFEGDLRFEDSSLPAVAQDSSAESKEGDKAEITIRDITLNQGLYIDSDQFLSQPPWWAVWRKAVPRFYSGDAPGEADDSTSKDAALKEDRRSWRELIRAFEIAKNVELKNYAEYRLRSSEEASQDGSARMSSFASRLFWGYGLRPARVLFWLAVVILAFAAIYWTQLSVVGADQNPIARYLNRARLALVFSVRTAWELNYGYGNSATPAFRVITTIESVLAKLVLACFAYALTQTSPLLSEIVKKLLP